MDSNHRPSGYEPDELPLLHAAPPVQSICFRSALCTLQLLGCVDLLSQRASRQYLRRCRVSRPGSGWDGVVPRRFAHTSGSGASAEVVFLGPRPALAFSRIISAHRPSQVFPQGSPRPCAPVACTCHHASSSGRLPSHLLGDLPARMAVSVLILRRISHLDAFSGSCFRT